MSVMVLNMIGGSPPKENPPGYVDLVSAVNVDDGTGDWGKCVIVVFDTEVIDANISASKFTITDSNGFGYIVTNAALGDDRKTVTLTMLDMNGAVGSCEVSCKIGNISSLSGNQDLYAVASFSPTGLVPPPLNTTGYENEHIEITGITAVGTLTPITYTDAQSGGEHIEITNITAVGTLTHINDI